MRAIGLVLALSACSLIAVTPPADPPQPAGDCTTSFVAPGVDLLGTIAAGAIAIFGLGLYISTRGGCTGDDCGVAGGAGLVVGVPAAGLAVLYGYSTSYGHRTVDRCVHQRAREAREAR